MYLVVSGHEHLYFFEKNVSIWKGEDNGVGVELISFNKLP